MLTCEKRKGTTGHDRVRERRGGNLKPGSCEAEKRGGPSGRALCGVRSVTLA